MESNYTLWRKIERLTDGDPADGSESSETNTRIYLKDDNFSDMMASVYGNQDYSYNVTFNETKRT